MTARIRIGTLAGLALVGAALLASAGAQAITWTGPAGRTWDVNDTTNGAIVYGTSYAFYTAFTLSVNGTAYNAGGASTPIWSGRGVQMAARTIGTGLSVQRFVWVPSGTSANDYLRYYDTFTNTGTGSVTVNATYGGSILSYGYPSVFMTSSGDTAVTTADTWYCVHDTYYGYGGSGSVWDDPSALRPTTLSLSGSTMNTGFSFSVPPGQTYAIMVFVVQNSSDPAIQATATWLQDLPEAALFGLTADQMMAIQNWQAGGAPVIRLVTPTPLEAPEGGTLALEVEVEDLEGDPFDVYWELDGDGAFDDGTGLTATFTAVGFDGPTTAVVSVRAQDDTGEERIFDIPIDVTNVPPVFESDPAVLPGLTAYRGLLWSYQLIVTDPANIEGETPVDPVIVDVVEKPAGMVYFGDMHFEWTPREEDVGTHRLYITADDRDADEPSEQDVTITVPDNAPPSAPVIISPLNDTVWTQRPTLIVENSVDMDTDDVLSYTFEVATSAEFTSAIARGNVFEVTGSTQTEWTVNTTLSDGARYYWRVWANDGHIDGPSSTAYFDVDLSSMTDSPDSTDASTDVHTDGLPPLPTDAGDCGCRTIGSGGAGAGWLAIGLALAALAAFSRRRRG